MKRELELWQFVADRLQKGERVMLLIVATSSGSSPGRPGYKMAVAEDGKLMGSIGGGVMEVNLVEQSRALLGTQASLPESSHGDGTRSPSISEQVHRKNVPNSSGMICSGKQTVIFKLLEPDELERVNEAISGARERRSRIMLLTPDTFGVGRPICPVECDIEFTRESKREFVYSERLGAKSDLIIIGGGHCALALSELMSKMDFHVSLFDDRPQLNTIEKNEFADEINVINSYDQIADRIESDERAFIVVMTLGYKTDAVVIRQLIDKDFRYFGVLGSKAKMKTLFRELIDEGYPKDRLALIRTPIGLPINSHSPEEIAVSIAAEIIAVKNGAKI